MQPTIKAEPIAQAADRRAALDSQTMYTSGGPSQLAKSETVRATDGKVSAAAMTSDERVRAAKAALNLQ
jgi:hypothetical protein